MNQFWRYSIRCLYMAMDIVAGYFSIVVACRLQSPKLPPAFDHSAAMIFQTQNPFRVTFALWLMALVVIAHLYRLYHTDRTASEWQELWRIIQSSVIATAVMIVLGYLLKIEGLPRTVTGSALAMMIAAFSVWRVAKRLFVEYLVAHGYNNRNLLIVGTGMVARSLQEEIQRYPAMGLRVKGFLHHPGDPIDQELKPQVLGTFADFRRVVTQHFIEYVIFAGHYEEEVFLRFLVQARKFGLAVDVVPAGYGMISGDIRQHRIGFVPVLEYSRLGKGFHHPGKRLFDIIVTTLGCLVLAVPMLVIGFLVVLDSRGPVFYYSERFGRGGRRFRMMKFRTMVNGADQRQKEFLDRNEADGPIFKMRRDPRVTRFGKFLRKYSLDELPQLLNVLKGEMSLVGPRPFPVDQIEPEDLRQLRRLGVRPGITGLWQVRGRSDTTFRRLLRWDSWYISNWSFGLDLRILWQTVPAVVKGRGAY